MKRAILTATVAFAAIAATVLPAYAAAPTTIYDATPVAGTPNIPSVGPEAYAFKEVGDAVTFAGSQRKLNAVTVTMSSWACQSGAWHTHDCLTLSGSPVFSHPITLSIYDAPVTLGDGTVVPGDLIARVTKTFSLPYRPSTNLKHCSAGGGWWNNALSSCFNGKAANITWNFTSLGLDLPNTAVFGVSYNTTSYGPAPIGTSPSCYGTSQGCPYDSLNVGLNATVVTGSKPYADTLFQNTSSGGNLCDSTPALNEFNLDSPTSACWAGYNPAIKVTAH